MTHHEPDVSTFIEKLGLLFSDEGMPLIAGRVTALLLVSEGPRSLDDIAVTLGVSRASVSNDTRRLVDKGLLVRLTLPGDRRTYYSFAPDSFQTMLGARIQSLTTLQKLLDEGAGLPVARDNPEVRNRIAEWSEFHSAVVESLHDLLVRWNSQSAGRSRRLRIT